ncbi:FG-GAP repeat protein [Paenibacillus sp. VCA1]|uniref:FG-GAP repeat protein n=1 Tax=Paenibacillus sp. VCA1 TaxID=3039148 RepID=UPI0028711C78|nr:FG-GAP repeat protein [Paenibacillus sp. VCA1]MDR9855304.1 FG-GAP repeat protein [Paenibacillus sp. VCA1]
MPRRFIIASVILTPFLFLAGCGVPATPVDLISPPLAVTNLQTDPISRDLAKLLPDQAQILSPMQEKGGKDISFGDLDGDGVDEAVVVFQVKNRTGKLLKAALFMQHNKKWRIVSEVDGFGYGLDVAEIKDVNHDGRPELALGWSLGDAGNGLDIYGWEEDKLKLISKKVYQGPLELD